MRGLAKGFCDEGSRLGISGLWGLWFRAAGLGFMLCVQGYHNSTCSYTNMFGQSPIALRVVISPASSSISNTAKY